MVKSTVISNIFDSVVYNIFTARGGAQRCQVTPYVLNFLVVVGGVTDSFIQNYISLNSLHMVGRAKIQKVLEPLPPWQRFGNPLPPPPPGGGGGEGGEICFFGLFHKVERKFKMFLNPWPQGIDLVTPHPGGGGGRGGEGEFVFSAYFIR